MPKIYSIYDKKTECYSVVFQSHDDVQAKRQIHDVMRSGDSLFVNYPNDYSLYYIADFDDSLGQYDNCIPPVLVAELAEFVRPVVISNA